MKIPGAPYPTGRYLIIKAGDHENPVTLGEVKAFGTFSSGKIFKDASGH